MKINKITINSSGILKSKLSVSWVKMGKKNPFEKTSKEYSSTTTIHGVRYFTEVGQSNFEYCSWIFVVFIATAIAALMSANAYFHWQENPVMTTVGSTGQPIDKIEFPSVTICPQVSTLIVSDAKVLYWAILKL